MKDLIIIGGGPAGITAAVYAARKKVDLCIVAKEVGGQATWSANIENYTGFQLITGPELVQKFRSHLEQYKFDLIEGEFAEKVEKRGGNFFVTLGSGKELTSKTLIIATGKKPKELGVPGEIEFRNKGVHYCATCDGAVFTGKPVAVVGGGNSGLDAAISMMKIASKVYLINVTEALGGDPVMQEKISKAANVEVLNKTKTIEILGDKFVSGIRVESGGVKKDIPLKGVFVEVGLVPNSDFIGCVEKNKLGEILINFASETSCPGIFAAGDVTNVPHKQIIIAAGDGAKAALSAFKYLSTHIS